MRNSNKFLGITLALLLGVGTISGCAPTAGTTPNQPVNINSSLVSGNSSEAKKQASNELKESLAFSLDDEAYMNDSEKISSNSFATKALLDKIEKAVDAKADVVAGVKLDTPIISTDAKANAKVSLLKRGKVFLGILETTGVVKKNEDGTFTVDAVKLKAEFDKKKVALKAEIKVSQETLSQLRRKNNTDVQKSEPEKVTNADGSITQTTKIHFENTRLGITRDNVVSITTKDGKVVNSTHSLEIKAKNYTEVATRVMLLNEDNSKDIVFDSTTTLNDGRKKEVHRTKEITAEGKGTATGNIKVMYKSGETKEFKTNSEIIVNNMGKAEEKIQESTTAIDTSTNVEVKVVEKVDGTATTEVKEEGKVTEASSLNVEQAVEASASSETSVTSAV